MPKVSFRMASASRESVFGVQTNTARKIHRSDHTEGRLTTAPSGCCVRKGTRCGHSASILGVTSATSRQPATVAHQLAVGHLVHLAPRLDAARGDAKPAVRRSQRTRIEAGARDEPLSRLTRQCADLQDLDV